MEISHGIELSQGPVLGRPFILLRHRIEVGQPVTSDIVAVPPDFPQFKSDWKALLARIESLEAEVAVLRVPWWERLWNWFRSL